MIGIYKIQNKLNGKIYIGQSVNITRRLWEHKTSKNAKPGNIDYYIQKEGIDNFEYDIIEECDKESLIEREIYWIKYYDSYNKGYNLTLGGEGSSLGEVNVNSCLNEEDVIAIRKAYNNHQRRMDVFDLFKDKISWSGFIAIWTGRNWRHVMPEVFTEENKQYHIKNAGHSRAIFTDDEIMQIREEYINMTLKQLQEKYKEKCSDRCIRGIVNGENYKYLPLYSKKKRRWLNGGEY